ncbi:MAG: acyl carrier protein [Phycisphaerales bacterium]
MNRDEIQAKVKDVLVDALGVDDDEVVPTAALGADLGAESIDYLDISFRLEKAFGIKIEQGEMIPEAALQNPEFVKDGKISDAGMAELKRLMPYADFTALEEDRNVTRVVDVFTVDAMVKFVEMKLEKK